MLCYEILLMERASFQSISSGKFPDCIILSIIFFLILTTFSWLKLPLLSQGVLEYLLLFTPFPLKWIWSLCLVWNSTIKPYGSSPLSSAISTEIRSWKGQRDTWSVSWHCRGVYAEVVFVTLNSGRILYSDPRIGKPWWDPHLSWRVVTDLDTGKDWIQWPSSPAEGQAVSLVEISSCKWDKYWLEEQGQGEQC